MSESTSKMKITFYVGTDKTARLNNGFIKTGELDLELIEAVVGDTYPGFTLTQGTGYWKGHKERTAVVTVLVDLQGWDNVIVVTTAREVATRLRVACHQDAVLMEWCAAEMELV